MRKLAAILGLLICVCTAGIAAARTHHHGKVAGGTDPTFTFSTDAPSPTWQCSVDGGAWTACPSPKSYTLPAGQHNVRLRATFTVPKPPPPPPPPPPAPVAPSNTTAPSISGTPQSGDTLTASPGTWSGDTPMTFSYKWSDGTTGKTDSLTDADVGQNVSVSVTASNDASTTATATSSSVGPVTPAPAPPPPPPPPPPNGLVPCDLTHAAGAGASSCWATHTGVQGSTGITEAQIKANPAAVGFTKHTGELVISQPNTTIDHEWIAGCITIADGADNTVIKNSLVTVSCNGSGDNAGGSAINTGQGPSIAKNTLIEDTTVDGGGACNGCNTAGLTVDGGKVLRVNAFGFTRTFLSDSNTASAPALFQDDYTHDFAGCVHDDGTWFDSSSYVTFQHGYVLMGDVFGSGCTTAALSGGSDFGPQNHITYDSNYADGADGESVHTGCGSTFMTVTGNALDSSGAKNASDGGYQALTGNTWSGNYTVDTSTGAKLGSWGPFSAGC